MIRTEVHPVKREELARRIKSAAYLEGEFTLRSGKKSHYYLDKYRFETQPEMLKALGSMFAEYMTDTTTIIAGAELGGVALAAATSIARAVPFIIGRNKKKYYGTANMFAGSLRQVLFFKLNGKFEHRSCLAHTLDAKICNMWLRLTFVLFQTPKGFKQKREIYKPRTFNDKKD